MAATLLFSLCSCKSGMYKDVTYREGGISFTLPNTMRRANYEEYDFYFTNRATVFTAKELDDEFYKENSLEPDMTAAEYVDYCIEANKLDKTQMEYKHDEARNVHNFRYIYDDDAGTSIFYYIVITGEPGNIWYIEMCCDSNDSSKYLPTFGEWKRTILAYDEAASE